MKYDAVIVGAGAAGLACARELSGAGKRICIIDARHRIGGRIDTRRVDGVGMPIELGAEFIHGANESMLARVAAAGLTAYELPDTHHWSSEGHLTRIGDLWEMLNGVLRPIARLERDVSFDAYLRRRRSLAPRVRAMAWNFVEGYHAAHADRISAKALSPSNDNTQLRIVEGYAPLMQWLAAGLDPERATLRLGTIALAVTWKKNDVAVECAEETLRARAVVCTIPIGVWKSGTLRFDPPLEEKERAVAKLEAGHVVKIVFRFRERFWDEINFVHTNGEAIPTWWTPAPLRVPVLTGWAGGHAADALLAEPPPRRIDRALDSMAKTLAVKRRTIDDLLVAAYTHDWQADPWSRGAYSYASVGGSGAHRALAKPVNGTLFFAGEATNGEEPGTVSGAIESGRRAARELLG